jgi:hypothetical protein
MNDELDPNIIIIKDDGDFGAWIQLGCSETDSPMTLIIQETDREEKRLPIDVNLRDLAYLLIKHI